MAPTITAIRTYRRHEEYVVDFFGDELIVTVTACPSEIGRWFHNVFSYQNYHHSSHPLVVGVGVNWTVPYSSSHDSNSSQDGYDSDSPPNSYYSDGQADILQLCVGERCLIIQLAGCHRVPKILHSFLEDPETTFVGIRNGQDARRLQQSKHGLEIENLLDIMNYVHDSEGRRLRSFEEIVEHCMGHQGVRLDPAISMSNWCAYNLRYDQIIQASVDAYVCFKLAVERRLWEYK